MPRGNAQIAKVHYKGSTDDFIVFVDSVDDLKAWKEDKTIPLAQVVGSFKIMVTDKHGAQGQLDGASRAALENEFGTYKDEEVIQQILEKGTIQEGTGPERGGDRNITQGGTIGHATGNRH